MKINKFFGLTTAAAAAALIATTANATTLEDIRHLGFLNCGVSKGLFGFSKADTNGKWTGLDVDLCRAIAAAVLGSAEKVKFTPLTDKERFTALQGLHNVQHGATRQASLNTLSMLQICCMD